ncbi:uncharacterized protein LOC110624198 [Manihot esculenta]|uniref:uncharacterized protein LOC110624198 n=1 Tax=Manihot esculenta TaxID=3983 RepID=UPI000B5D449F|nr:uncharacterized protein LOC110624198 [Manihot esculenta]
MDVKTIFLNGNLLEDVYMIQPESFESKKFSNKVYKLQSSIYGLKQTSQSWNICFDEIVKQLDFVKIMDELCVYKKVNGSEVYGDIQEGFLTMSLKGIDELKVHGYSDANFQLDFDDNKSQSGYNFTLNDEAAAKEKFISELGVVPSIVDPVILNCNNNGVIA